MTPTGIPSDTPTGTIPPSRQMLEALMCPITQDTLRYDAAAQELISEAAQVAYPIRNGIPIMLASEARKITD